MLLKDKINEDIKIRMQYDRIKKRGNIEKYITASTKEMVELVILACTINYM